MNSDDVGYTTDGTRALISVMGQRVFSFPKSVKLIKHLISQFPDKNCVILDFFAGSGTTLHAVNLLNAEDGGHRRCIMVTNNEVSAEDARTLTQQGYKPGDPEWEKYGIAKYVTWPRTVCSISGRDPNGQPIKGNHSENGVPMSDGFASNCEYYKLTFLDRNMVSLGMQFREILPLLWLKSGAVGKRPELPSDEDLPEMMVLPENSFAILLEEECFAGFARRLAETSGIHIVYFVTDSEDAFREMSANVPAKQTFQLYRDYIDNFVIGGRRATR